MNTYKQNDVPEFGDELKIQGVNANSEKCIAKLFLRI